MPLKVGELYATMSVDAKGFNKGMSDARSTFDKFKGNVADGVRTIGKTMVGITTVGLGLGAAVFKIGADYNRLQQSSRAALTTLLGSAEAASAQMDKLDDFARNSPFAKQVFITAQQQLLGFGMAAEDVIPTLDAVQNAVAAVGGNNEQVAQVTYALAQMQGQGKLTGETLNQLGQYGIDAATILGQEWGKTGAEIRDMASKPGGIPADQVFAPLTEGLMKRFGGATDLIKLQMDGALDRIKGATRDIGSAIAAPFIDPKGGGIGVDWTNKIADLLRALESQVKPFVDIMVDRFAPSMERVSPMLERAADAIKAWNITGVNTQLDKLSQYGTLLAPVTGALLAIGGASIRGPLGMLVPTINPVVAALGALVLVSPEARDALRGFADSLTPLLGVIGTVGESVSHHLTGALEVLIPAIGKVLESAGEVASLFAIGLSPAISGAAAVIEPAAHIVAGFAGFIADLPTPILMTVTALAALKALKAGTALEGVGKGIKNVYTSMKEVRAAKNWSDPLDTGIRGLDGLARASDAATGGIRKFGDAIKANAFGLAITGVATAIGWLTSSNQAARQAQEEHTRAVAQFADVLKESNGAIDANVYNHRMNEIVMSGLGDTLEGLGIGVRTYTEATLGNADAQDRVRQALEENRGSGLAWDATVKMITEDMESQALVTEDAKRRLDQLEKSTDDTASATEIAAAASGMFTDALVDNTTELIANTDAQRDNAGEAISLREAQIRAADSTDKLTEAAKSGEQVTRDASGAIDLNAESTRRADEALLNFVGDQRRLIEVMEEQGATSEEVDAALRDMSDSFIDAAVAQGYTREEAEELIKTYGLFPDRVETEAALYTAEASRVAEAFFNKWNGKVISMPVKTTGGAGPAFATPKATGGLVEFYAQGGMRSLNPMSPIAQIVPPNTWRVIGDRPRGDEAYIPIERTARSMQILDETARRLGRITLPAQSQQFASGAVASSPSLSVGPQGGDFFSDALIDRLATAIGSRVFEGTRAGINDSANQVRNDVRAGF